VTLLPVRVLLQLSITENTACKGYVTKDRYGLLCSHHGGRQPRSGMEVNNGFDHDTIVAIGEGAVRWRY